MPIIHPLNKQSSMADIQIAAVYASGLAEMLTDIVHDMNIPTSTPYSAGLVPLCDIIAGKIDEIRNALEGRS